MIYIICNVYDIEAQETERERVNIFLPQLLNLFFLKKKNPQKISGSHIGMIMSGQK